MPNFLDSLKHAWNAFRGRDRPYNLTSSGESSWYRPDRVHLRRGNERTIITAIYNRIAMDVSSHKIEHVIIDENGRYVQNVKDHLNECLTVEANIDQTSRAFYQDVVLSMFDEGCVAIVSVDATIDPSKSASYDIKSLRTGKIITWYPRDVIVEVYNDLTGRKEQLKYSKSDVAIVENPFFAVMNESNSILQRLVRKLAILDQIDEQAGAGKLDLIIQLPYIIKSDARKAQAEARRKDIEHQLSETKYGIAYTDGTERITQLNRPIENNLMSQIEYLMNVLYSQLGITPEILNGTADEKTMLNYNTRTIEPILSAITDEMKRKFLSKTARTQGHSIMFSNDPFRLVPISNIADIADRFTRNEILSPNEVRGIIGFKPNDDPQADELRNRNINQNGSQLMAPMDPEQMAYEEEAPEYSDNQADMNVEDPNYVYEQEEPNSG